MKILQWEKKTRICKVSVRQRKKRRLMISLCLCQGKTVIIVAHRLGIVQECDRIAVIGNQGIEAVGNFTWMKEHSPYFKKAWEDYNMARNMEYRLKGGEAV